MYLPPFSQLTGWSGAGNAACAPSAGYPNYNGLTNSGPSVLGISCAITIPDGGRVVSLLSRPLNIAFVTDGVYTATQVQQAAQNCNPEATNTLTLGTPAATYYAVLASSAASFAGARGWVGPDGTSFLDVIDAGTLLAPQHIFYPIIKSPTFNPVPGVQ